MPFTYVQIGAGAGDLDSRANCRDGFSEYVKMINPSQIERIILLEPNPVNIPLLKKCWEKYPQAEIHQFAIRPSSSKIKMQTFYYAEEDQPHYQVFSMSKKHVKKHYPKGTIRKIQIETVTIKEFFRDIVGNKHIDLLSLDIEGIDSKILLEIDWETLNCTRVSFEILHLGSAKKKVYKVLEKGGYKKVGNGLDVNGYDLMYEKVKNLTV